MGQWSIFGLRQTFWALHIHYNITLILSLTKDIYHGSEGHWAQVVNGQHVAKVGHYGIVDVPGNQDLQECHGVQPQQLRQRTIARRF